MVAVGTVDVILLTPRLNVGLEWEWGAIFEPRKYSPPSLKDIQ